VLREWKIPKQKRKYDPKLICEACTNLYFPKREKSDRTVSEFVYETSNNFVEKPFNGETLADSTFSYILKTPDFHNFPDTILDCIEINYPYKAYLTACHDGSVSIISKELNKIVGSLETGHKTGVRQLDY